MRLGFGTAVAALFCLWTVAALAQSAAIDDAYNRYRALHAQGRYAEAEPFARRAMELGEKEFGAEHPNTAIFVNNLAELYRSQGRFAEAEPLYKRSLAISEKALGPDHPGVATGLNNLALLYQSQGRLAAAEPLYKRALAIRRQALGPDHPGVAQSLNNLADLYRLLDRYGEAEPLFKQSLATWEKALGPDHPDVAAPINNLAALQMAQGRYDEAEPLYKRSLAIFEKALGPLHPTVALSLNNLAGLYQNQGRFREAEPLYARALAIRERTLGPDHPYVALSLNDLSELYRSQGRHAEAEPLYKRAVTVWEKVLGPDHFLVAASINNLALLYQDQGRYREAEPLMKRSLAIREKALGPKHAEVASGLNNLASLYETQGRHAEAEPLMRRALAILEKVLGPDHPQVATNINNLAALKMRQHRYAEAAPLMQRAVKIYEKALGPRHPGLATGLNNLAGLYDALDRYADSEPLYKRSLAIFASALGPDHPNVSASLNNLAQVYWKQGRLAEALDHIRRASAIRRDRTVRAGGEVSPGAVSEQKTVRHVFLRHAEIALAAADAEPARRAELTAEAFEAAQLAQATGAAAAVARMSARFAAGDDALASAVRARQDAAARWERTDKALTDALSSPADKRDASRESRLRGEIKALDTRLAALDAQLARRFPKYAELATPRPVPLADLRALLADDEALIAYNVWSDATFLWVARRDGAAAHRLAIGGDELSRAVARLRGGLDPTGISGLDDVPPFETTEAYALYQKIFAPAESLLKGVRHLFVVPDGALQSLPLGVLVSERTQGEFRDFSGYRQVPWLARAYALSTLPSVASLRSLRTFAKAATARTPFTGFGDPALEGKPGQARGVALAGLFRGAVADVAAVRQLPPLPDTAGELRAMAAILHADEKRIFLRREATETAVKSADLADSRVVAFATHGLVAGEMKGAVEPALVLTPPSEGTAKDDGLLTASEVARLKLDADLVILSACNTAAADGAPEAEGLSGLAKAFFYAGSRALLVSHWPVVSDAAVKLTTGMLARMAANPNGGRADALRQSMLALMNDNGKPHYAHPMFWAPFVVVGEGGTPVRN